MKSNLDLVAAVITVFSLLVSVVYATGGWEAWDALLCLVALLVLLNFRHSLSEHWRERLVLALGLGVALVIGLASILALIGLPLNFLESWPSVRVDGYFLASLLVAGGCFLWSKFFWARGAARGSITSS